MENTFKSYKQIETNFDLKLIIIPNKTIENSNENCFQYFSSFVCNFNECKQKFQSLEEITNHQKLNHSLIDNNSQNSELNSSIYENLVLIKNYL